MSRICTICSHPERAAIDKALAAGEGVRSLASRYGAIGRSSVQRHKEEHLPQSLVEAAGAEEIKAALDVVTQLKAINGASLQILSDARKGGDADIALKAIDRIQKQIELQAKLLGQIDDRPVINVLVTPEWLTVRQQILVALAPYPEARLAVAEAINSADA
ncbi:MAG: hypothetical protein V4671_22650 [Armatimonadota bacterium]